MHLYVTAAWEDPATGNIVEVATAKVPTKRDLDSLINDFGDIVSDYEDANGVCVDHSGDDMDYELNLADLDTSLTQQETLQECERLLLAVRTHLGV